MKTYYQNDANLRFLRNKTIAIVGYGIIGRATALNLRDSGCKVIVGNVKDSYFQTAKKDDFEVVSISDAVKQASIIFFLIPDQAQERIFESEIAPNLNKHDMLIFAHGFSIHYQRIKPPKGIDICLLAPRMPGKPIREYYLAGGGVPAFATVHVNASGRAKEIVLALAKAVGYTKAGVMDITFKEETEIDLFIEQYLLPTIIRSIRLSFDTLVENGFTPESTLMELYASGEIGELLMLSSKIGIYEVWRKNASPTCQYGIFRNSEYVFPEKEAKKKINKIIKEIRDETFVKSLDKEADNNYKSLKEYDNNNKNSDMEKTQRKLDKIIKYREE